MSHLKIIILGILTLSLAGGVPLSAAEPTARLSLNGAPANVAYGAEFSLDVLLDTGGQAVSGTDVTIRYSSNLSFIRLDTANSVMTTEIPAAAPSDNQLTFTRLRFDTGYTGSNGHLAKLIFKATSEGAAAVTIIKESSQVIPFSDPDANILGAVTNASFSVDSEQVASNETTNQNVASSDTTTQTTDTITAATPSPSPEATPSAAPEPRNTDTTNKTSSQTKKQPSSRPVRTKATSASANPSTAPEASPSGEETVASPVVTPVATDISTEVESIDPVQSQIKASFGTVHYALLALAALLAFGALPYAIGRLKQKSS